MRERRRERDRERNGERERRREIRREREQERERGRERELLMVENAEKRSLAQGTLHGRSRNIIN